MAPHSSLSMDVEDSIEIQHVDGRHTPIVRLGTSNHVGAAAAGGSGAASDKVYRRMPSSHEHDPDDSIVLHEIRSTDSEDQDTFFDTFSSICMPLCAPGCYGLPKSALKKPGNASSSGIQSKRSVSFNSLTVREYDLTLGDHPSSASGPPIQLDWDHKNESVVDLNTYEQERQPRKTRRQLKMSFEERERILQSKGYSMDELKNAWMESLKIRQQRYETVMTGSLTTKVEEAWESACRKFNRLFTLTQDMEGYEVKAEGAEGTREAFSYVKKSEEDEIGLPGDSAPQPSAKWSLFDSGDASSGSALTSWLVAPCSGSTHAVAS